MRSEDPLEDASIQGNPAFSRAVRNALVGVPASISSVAAHLGVTGQSLEEVLKQLV